MVEFTVTAEGYYRLETSPADPESDEDDTVITLFDSQGNELVENDDYNDENLYSRIHTFLEPGNYYLIVTEFDGLQLNNCNLKISSFTG